MKTPAELTYETGILPRAVLIVPGVLFLLAAFSLDFTLNQILAIGFTLTALTAWFYDKAAGLTAAMIFLFTKPFWVRMSFAFDTRSTGNGGFDLLGITPALLLAGMIVWQLFLDHSSGVRLCPDRTRKLMLAFVAVSAATVPLSPSILVGLGGFERNVLPNMMILFLAASVLTEISRLEKLVKSLLVLGIVSCLYAIGQYIYGLYPWELAWFQNMASENGLSGWLTIGVRGIEFRIFSIFYGYMDFFFTNVLIFALTYALRPSLKGGWKYAFFIYVISWMVILALSLERMPILMISIVVFGLAFFKSGRVRRRKTTLGAFGILTAIYTVLLLTAPAMKTSGADKLVRVAELANPFEATSILDRVETKWLPSLEKISANPLGAGIGYGSQTKASATADNSGDFVLPHNELIQKTLETGIVGGIIFLLLLISVFKDCLRHGGSETARTFRKALAGTTISFWFCGMVNLPFSGSSGLLYWCLAGVALGLERQSFYNEICPKLSPINADKNGG
jgi:O-antigen ligase